jgi:dTMP kinase
MYIAIEGIDGSGKTTVAKQIHATMSQWLINVGIIREPSDSIFGRRIRESLSAIDPVDEYALFLADRISLQRNINRAAAMGDHLVSDRCYLSSVAYQGPLDKHGWQNVLEDNEDFFAVPDLVIILRIPVELALARIAKRGFSMPLEGEDRLRKAAAIYDDVEALRKWSRCPCIVSLDAADKSPELVLGECMAIIAQRLRGVLHPQ